ncbi:MAG: hypothetical protein HY376_00460 [Candidatus Blackburnbacteria bacterium]|nr:hypothetical protein [Candidatus Blackburnbacteria bacterium]
MQLASSYLLAYENKWVAVYTAKKTVVAYGRTVGELNKKLQKVKNKKVILFKVMPFNTTYSPNGN